MSRYFLFFFLAINTPLLVAQSISDLYTAAVSVTSAEEADRDLAMKQALIQVLVKLSGNRAVLNDPRVKARLAQAEQFVEQFEYQVRPYDGQRLLVVNFDAAAVKQLLQDFGLSQWSNARPTLLIWIVLDTGTEQIVINQIERVEQVNHLSSEAATRGLPILFPILDLEDLRTLKVTDVIVGRREALAQVARRYNVQTLWAGRVTQEAETWQGQWHLLIGSEQFSWQTKATNLATLLTEGLHETVDKIVKRSIVFDTTPTESADGFISSSAEESFTLRIKSLSNLDDYARVRDYLQHLDIVVDLQIQQMQPEQAVFLITVKGGKTALDRALSLGHLLIPDTAAADLDAVYRFTASPW